MDSIMPTWRAQALMGSPTFRIFSDAPCMAHLPTSSDSLTVLLAKTLQPTTWGHTTPITLSSVMLRVFSQLLLGRCRHLLLDEVGIQWAEKGKQTQELIYILRRLGRMSADWGLVLFILILDIAKAFDTVIQSNMGELVMRNVAIEGGLPWEARAWTQLIRSDKLTIATDEFQLNVTQTNGIRQGSPDSPVLFASLMADRLGGILPSKENCPQPLPTSGGSYMEDTCLWAFSVEHLQNTVQENPMYQLGRPAGQLTVGANKLTFQALTW